MPFVIDARVMDTSHGCLDRSGNAPARSSACAARPPFAVPEADLERKPAHDADRLSACPARAPSAELDVRFPPSRPPRAGRTALLRVAGGGPCCGLPTCLNAARSCREMASSGSSVSFESDTGSLPRRRDLTGRASSERATSMDRDRPATCPRRSLRPSRGTRDGVDDERTGVPSRHPTLGFQ
jgi:hypothetical protein